MTNKQFKKGIEDLRNIRMTDGERTHMLKSILATPTESPYVKPGLPVGRRVSMFAFIYSHHVQMVLVACLVVATSLGGISYASDDAIPGDILYSVKIRLVEPVFDVVNKAPEDKIVWEEEKVERRIVEAEMLAEIDELNDERSEELERKIEESSRAFVRAVDEASGEKAESRKEEFRKKFETKEGKSKVENLRRTAREAVD